MMYLLGFWAMMVILTVAQYVNYATWRDGDKDETLTIMIAANVAFGFILLMVGYFLAIGLTIEFFKP